MLIDTHAHIDMECYNEDFDNMLIRSKEAGVETIIIPAVEPSGFEKILKIANLYDNIYCQLGLHPQEAQKEYDEIYDEIKELAKKHKKVVAIGETGLDYYWDTSYNDLQKKVFEKQIILAEELNLPIVVHDREAHQDCYDILQKIKPDIPVIFHCYSGSWEFAKQLIKSRYYIAIGGVVTFKNAKKLQEVAINIPLENLLLETDSPYLTPIPHRGKQNEPSYVKLVAEKIAELKNIDFNKIADITTQNAKKVFSL